MKAYEKYSAEELRLADYAAGLSGPKSSELECFHNIFVMKAYERYSPEELRLADYDAGRRFPGPTEPCQQPSPAESQTQRPCFVYLSQFMRLYPAKTDVIELITRFCTPPMAAHPALSCLLVSKMQSAVSSKGFWPIGSVAFLNNIGKVQSEGVFPEEEMYELLEKSIELNVWA